MDVRRYPVIPWPRSLEARDGAFVPSPGLQVSIASGDDGCGKLAELLAGYLRELSGLAVTVVNLGGVLGDGRNNGLDAHDGSVFRPRSMK